MRSANHPNRNREIDQFSRINFRWSEPGKSITNTFRILLKCHMDNDDN